MSVVKFEILSLGGASEHSIQKTKFALERHHMVKIVSKFFQIKDKTIWKSLT